MIEIDGNQGEGGGQILRSALTLSMLTRQPFHLVNIRARRTRPGLMPQHLKSIEAAVRVCGAEVRGAAQGSMQLTFTPGAVHPGKFRLDIGTAGAVTLVLQTVFLPLGLAGDSSTIAITGGTHVPWSPCFDYLNLLWLPCMARIGFNARIEMLQAGFYPQGGGEIQAQLQPAATPQPLELVERGALLRIRGISAVAGLDPEIARRQKLQALRRIEPFCRDVKIQTVELKARSKGTFLLLLAHFEHSQACYFGLGEQGKRAERVADEAVEALQAFLGTDGAVDQYLADQLVLPLSLAGGPSILRTCRVTGHLLTQAEIVRNFLPVKITITGGSGEPGTIQITPGAD